MIEMNNDMGRRIFLAVAAICLMSIIYLCAEGRTIIRWTAEVSNPRQNESLYLERREDDVIYIGGEGKLYGTDMQAMVEGESMTRDDVRHIIIGDGITEIGYDAINKYGGLQTLRLGENVSVTGNGSVRECGSLRFVFLPKGLSSTGKDFLGYCDGSRIITDGTAEQLPDMPNVSKDAILEGIDSYDALVAACGEENLPAAMRQWWP